MKTATRFGFALFCLLLFPGTGNSCSCRLAETFCEQVTPENSTRILRGTVLALYTRPTAGSGHEIPFIDVVISEIYHGETVPDTVSLAGQDGLNCATTMNSTLFPIGQEMVFFVYGGFDPNGSYFGNDNIVDYPVNELLGCGPSYLPVIEGRVQGAILPGVTEQSLPDFVENLANCLGFVNTREPVGSQEVKITPNPSSGLLRIEQGKLVLAQMMIYDLNGREIRRFTGDRIERTGPIEIDLSDVPAGMYFVRIRTSEGSRITRKIFIQ